MLCRLAPLLAVLALAVAGCGGDDEPAAKPLQRFGPDAVEGMVAVERIRARLVPVTDLVAAVRHADAAVHLAAARELWVDLAPRIERDDPVLAREVSVAFDRVERAIARRGTFDAVRDVAGPLQGQLLGGVREELVDKEARLDSGVNAATLVRLLDDAERAYAAGSAEDREHAFGLVDRSQSVARETAADLGPRRDAVIEGLKALREAAFPDGILLPTPPAPLDELSRRAEEIRTALRERFEIAG